jgi:hypothetical protein
MGGMAEMAIDPFRWSRWSPHLGNAITIALGIPVVISSIAGWWAYVSGAGLSIAFVILAAFMMSLWCSIGILWLMDRAEKTSPDNARLIDCSWGLRIDALDLTRDLGNPNGEWQVRLILRNAKTVTLKAATMHRMLTIEGMVPTEKLEYSGFPYIVGPGEAFGFYLPAYKSGVLPAKERYRGEIDVSFRYGHVDGNYTRKMTRCLYFDAIIKPEFPPISGLTFVPRSATTRLAFGLREQDRDEPYNEPLSVVIS